MTDRKPAKLEKTLYVAAASATSGRDGRIKSDDGILDMAITPPKALGGTGAGTNPEQLFAAGYASCFGGALGVVARLKKITTGPVTMSAKVSL
ncbi:MAG: Ohr family peroxiredoxin, partial [Proteobacteria bacterium]|nr:Ohr family peroxiredoxin [Pseudomonadota bacterium]